MKYCKGCEQNLENEFFSKSSTKKDGLESRCKSCKHIRYTEKRSHYLQLAKIRVSINREKILEHKRFSYHEKKNEINEKRRAKRAIDPELESSKQRSIRAEIKKKCFEAMGGKCQHCSVEDVDVLCIDHVIDDGQAERASGMSSITLYRNMLKNPNRERYQVLCFNCNLRKSILRDRSGDIIGINKKCPTCLIEKDYSAFKSDSKYKDKRYYECRKCDRERILALKTKAVLKFNRKSCPCGSSDILTLSFDHVNDDGVREHGLGRQLYSAIVNGQADLNRYQILCMNCNLKKYANRRSLRHAIAGFTDQPTIGERPPKAVVSNQKSFQLEELKISRVTDKTQFIQFFDSNHYAGYGRHGSIGFTASIGEEIIAGAKFASPIRHGVTESVGLDYDRVLELDRFCIDGGSHIKNLASYFLSRVIKMIKKEHPNLTHLVSFADPEHGHLGTIYLSSNWKDMGYGTRSYKYVDEEGLVIHKKTVYNAAKSRGLKESEYANSLNYRRIYTTAKRKFLYELR